MRPIARVYKVRLRALARHMIGPHSMVICLLQCVFVDRNVRGVRNSSAPYFSSIPSPTAGITAEHGVVFRMQPAGSKCYPLSAGCTAGDSVIAARHFQGSKNVRPGFGLLAPHPTKMRSLCTLWPTALHYDPSRFCKPPGVHSDFVRIDIVTPTHGFDRHPAFLGPIYLAAE